MGPVSGWLLACAVHRVGLVERGDGGADFVSADGGRESLVLVGEGPSRLRSLGGYLVELEGRRTAGRITVGTFRVLEGPGGFGVWFGPVQVLGSQVGVADPTSGQLVLVDDGAAEELRAFRGQWVAAEGYVDGPQRVHVLAFTVVE